jgi:hypothetical protein
MREGAGAGTAEEEGSAEGAEVAGPVMDAAGAASATTAAGGVGSAKRIKDATARPHAAAKGRTRRRTADFLTTKDTECTEVGAV